MVSSWEPKPAGRGTPRPSENCRSKYSHQPRSISGWPNEAISQSITAAARKSSQMMLPIRLSPQLMTTSPSSGGWWSTSHRQVDSITGTVSPSVAQSRKSR